MPESVDASQSFAAAVVRAFAPPRLDSDAIARLRRDVAGPVLVAGEATEGEIAAEARAWNLATRHSPALVVGATRPEDVVAAVRFAASQGLPVAVQSTGHGAIDAFTGGLLITTRRMDDVTVDPSDRTVRVGAGAVWAQVVEAAAPHGLAPLSGSSSGVGVVGFTLGGGMGLLARRHGFAADHVRSLEVVTADGVVRLVDAQHERDLFWALRGGKGSFGIVTSLVVGLVDLPAFTAGALVFPGDSASQVLHAWRRWAPSLPDDATTSVALMRLPDAPMVPEPLRGVLSVHVRFAYLGSKAEADQILAPVRGCAQTLADDVVTRPYAEADLVHRDPVDPMPTWEQGGALVDLPAAAVEALLRVAGPAVEVPLILVELRLMGGALAREPEVPNAVAGREAAFNVFVVGAMVPGLEVAVARTGAAVLDALRPWAGASALTNFLGHAGGRERVCATWPMALQARLRATKTIYDAADMFSHGHAVLPSVSPADLADEPIPATSPPPSPPPTPTPPTLPTPPTPQGSRPGQYWDVEQCRWARGPDA